MINRILEYLKPVVLPLLIEAGIFLAVYSLL